MDQALELPELSENSEEGFIDLTFRISDLVDTGTHYRFHMSATHNTVIVGVDVEIVKGIQSGLDKNANLIKSHVYTEGVKFIRSGERSDWLVVAIAELYDIPVYHQNMVKCEKLTAIALHQGPIEMDREPIKLKLFGREGEDFDPDTDYYESFFNIDLPNGYVYWNEKDQEYRLPLLRAFAIYVG